MPQSSLQGREGVLSEALALEGRGCLEVRDIVSGICDQRERVPGQTADEELNTNAGRTIKNPHWKRDVMGGGGVYPES